MSAPREFVWPATLAECIQTTADALYDRGGTPRPIDKRVADAYAAALADERARRK